MTSKIDPYEKYGFQELDVEEQMESDPYAKYGFEEIKEITEQEPEKETQYLGRFAKGLAKSPGFFGDILSLFGGQLPQQLPGQAARVQLEAEATPEQLIGLVDADDVLPSYAPLATTEQFSEFAEELGLPKGEAETFGERAVELGGEFLGGNLLTGGIGAEKTLFQTAVKPFVKSFAPGAALAGAEAADLPPWAQALSTIGASLLANRVTGKSLRDINTETYKRANALLPETDKVSAKQITKQLDPMKKELLKGGLAPSEKAVLNAIEQVEGKIVAGQIPVDNLTALKRSFNEHIRSIEVAKEPRAKKLIKSINQTLDKTLESYGKKQNPEWLKLYREANSAHRGLSESRYIETQLQKLSPYMKYGLVKLIGSPFAAIGGVLSPALKGAEVMTSLARNKGLRQLYGKVLKDASKDNIPALQKSANKFLQEFKSEEPDLYYEFIDQS